LLGTVLPRLRVDINHDRDRSYCREDGSAIPDEVDNTDDGDCGSARQCYEEDGHLPFP
jgi:hypothetical protein